jgi:hypothetical protein
LLRLKPRRLKASPAAASARFCASDLHFHHHVFSDDPAAEKTAATTTEVNRSPAR